MLFLSVLALVIPLQPLVDENVLEPSVQNEVDHALNVAPTNKFEKTAASIDFAKLSQTNGMSATETAIALISAQKSDGRWFSGTNEVTGAAVEILRRLSGYPEAPESGLQEPSAVPGEGTQTNRVGQSSNLEIRPDGR